MQPSNNITLPDVRSIVTPVLSCLPGAAVSTKPATNVLPLLTPILRQRVQVLSEASQEPWIRLLTYETAKVSRLASIAQSGVFDPHPVSGEIEMDWDYNVDIRYKRVDQETLQTLVVLGEMDLFVRLVYCAGDEEGGSDKWRVGEVGVASEPSPLANYGGFSSLDEAEKAFQASKTTAARQPSVNAARMPSAAVEDEEDDDDYWARYDNTPARTPANQQSPAPQSMMKAGRTEIDRTQSAEDAYYSQYDSIQPAMDPHDPDEEVEHVNIPPPLGLGRVAGSRDSTDQSQLNETSGTWTLTEAPKSPSSHSNRSHDDEERDKKLLHPRPASSASSNGSRLVSKLEETAEKREQSEFGVKQHISRSIRSLFLLSRSAGIDREEFERMVQTELDVLGMVEDDI
ncbi:hypothetical protein QBC38DRAFT_367257 [Podospora fimiseda]|uniref:Uncharacterized protein n=1 Tax=Podospora fimiseda TaxID=252190 RepID=A0AAN7GSU5_9PEZI|nr:hypothetical protein QBC38DRAFT_367257 [Podospora fimiseda]